MTSLAVDIRTVKTTVASYYKDTGKFPRQFSGQAGNQDLIKQRIGVQNWKGPYIDKDFNNKMSSSGFFNAGLGTWTFDINGDCRDDYGSNSLHANVVMAWLNGLTAMQAKGLNDQLDNDGDRATWFKGGRVRTSNSDDPGATTHVTLYILLNEAAFVLPAGSPQRLH